MLPTVNVTAAATTLALDISTATMLQQQTVDATTASSAVLTATVDVSTAVILHLLLATCRSSVRALSCLTKLYGKCVY